MPLVGVLMRSPASFSRARIRQSDPVQAGCIYMLDRRDNTAMGDRFCTGKQKCEVLQILKSPRVSYEWMIVARIADCYIETFTMTQAWDCLFEEGKYEAENREKGHGVRLNVRAMPQGTTRSDLLSNEKWEKEKAMRVMPERTPSGTGKGAWRLAPGHLDDL